MNKFRRTISNYNMQNKEAMIDIEISNSDSDIQVNSIDQVKENKSNLGKRCLYSHFTHVGNISIYVMLLILIIGLTISNACLTEIGLFGASGGITNSLAVYMLFERVPILIGSGVIPRKFKEIRLAIKTTMMDTFFSQDNIQDYLENHSSFGSQALKNKIANMANSQEIDNNILKKLTEFSQTPQGAMLLMASKMMGGLNTMVPFIKPPLIEVAYHFSDVLDQEFDSQKMKQELDGIMERELLKLTPNKVKQIIEDVIRQHLGWLIVWGNVFGGLIGLISYFVKLGL